MPVVVLLVSLLTPGLLLVTVVGLGHYEDRLFGPEPSRLPPARPGTAGAHRAPGPLPSHRPPRRSGARAARPRHARDRAASRARRRTAAVRAAGPGSGGASAQP
ncbi:hypothetical protein [Streptomyces sp. NPDC050504]|uniref:hypothetical protein n=1 Tax=Streptomyces sp. NPDC050504 TaxID=3365618 RepID=UPI00378B9101